jgi:hypothetical protein
MDRIDNASRNSSSIVVLRGSYSERLEDNNLFPLIAIC